MKLELKPRQQTFLHPSWLGAYLAGESQCLFKLHTQANFCLPKTNRSFDLESYKIRHQ